MGDAALPSDPPSGDAAFDLDLAVASLSADAADGRALLTALVGRLRDALGDRLQVSESGGGLLHRSRELTGVTITVGDDVYEATMAGGAIRTSVGHQSGGIRIRSEQVGMDAWLRSLLGSLQHEAATSQVTRTALEAMVIGGTP